jgi:hypothetical protein
VLITGGGAESIMVLLPPGVLRAASALLDASSKLVATKIKNVDFIGLPPFCDQSIETQAGEVLESKTVPPPLASRRCSSCCRTVRSGTVSSKDHWLSGQLSGPSVMTAQKLCGSVLWFLPAQELKELRQRRLREEVYPYVCPPWFT